MILHFEIRMDGAPPNTPLLAAAFWTRMAESSNSKFELPFLVVRERVALLGRGKIELKIKEEREKEGIK